MDAAQIRHLVDRAHRIALDERTVTCIIVPNDLGEEPAVPEPPHKHGTIHSAPAGAGRASFRARRPRARGRHPERGHEVAMLVGQGALGATPR